MPGGETGRQVLNRYLAVVTDLRRRHLDDPNWTDDIVVVSHGAAIRLVAAVLAGLDGNFVLENHLANTEAVALAPLTGDRWVRAVGIGGSAVAEPPVPHRGRRAGIALAFADDDQPGPRDHPRVPGLPGDGSGRPLLRLLRRGAGGLIPASGGGCCGPMRSLPPTGTNHPAPGDQLAIPTPGPAVAQPVRIGMLLLLLSLVLFSVLHWLGPLVTVAGLGVPLLFVLYLWQSDVLRDMPGHVLLMATVLGAGLGVGWVVVTGGLVARSYGIPMAAGFVLQHLIGVGLAISVGGALLMASTGGGRQAAAAAPDLGVLGWLRDRWARRAVLHRRRHPHPIGPPQFTAGLIDNIRPSRLMLEAGLYGIAMPLTAAAAGGDQV